MENINREIALKSLDLDLNPSDGIRLLHDFAFLNSRHTLALAEGLSIKLSSIQSSNELGLLLSALSWANYPVQNPGFSSTISKKAVELFKSPDSEVRLNSVHEWWLHTNTNNQNSDLSMAWMQLLMRSRGAVQICSSCLNNHNVSNFSKQVRDLLVTEKGGFTANQLCPMSGYHLDVVDLEKRIVVEVIGSIHYITDYYNTEMTDDEEEEKLSESQTKYSTRFALSGPNEFKKRILESFGWKVLIIPYYKWVRKQRGVMRKEWLFSEIDSMKQ